MRSKATMEVIVGQKLSESEVDGVVGKIEEGQPTPSESAEVSGRCRPELVVCPVCRAINYVYIEDDAPHWYRCWNTADGVHYFKV